MQISQQKQAYHLYEGRDHTWSASSYPQHLLHCLAHSSFSSNSYWISILKKVRITLGLLFIRITTLTMRIECDAKLFVSWRGCYILRVKNQKYSESLWGLSLSTCGRNDFVCRTQHLSTYGQGSWLLLTTTKIPKSKQIIVIKDSFHILFKVQRRSIECTLHKQSFRDPDSICFFFVFFRIISL